MAHYRPPCPTRPLPAIPFDETVFGASPQPTCQRLLQLGSTTVLRARYTTTDIPFTPPSAGANTLDSLTITPLSTRATPPSRPPPAIPASPCDQPPPSSTLPSPRLASEPNDVAHSPQSAQIPSPLQPLDVDKKFKIGRGTYGIVYLALWKRQRVAVKTWFWNVSDASIRWEIELNKTLQHSNIIRFMGAGLVNNCKAMVMAFAEKGSLRCVIRHGVNNGARLDWPTKYKIQKQIASALDYLHSEGILHRDIKSANVLMTSNLDAQLSDFGFAARMTDSGDIEDEADSSMRGSAVGTLRWRAPEHMFAPFAYSRASDVYAFGMVMWEISTDCLDPFSDKNDTDVVHYVRSGGREVIPDDTPDGFRYWIERCWDSEPANRPKASDMFNHDIEGLDSLERDGEDMIGLSSSSDQKKLLPSSLEPIDDSFSASCDHNTPQTPSFYRNPYLEMDFAGLAVRETDDDNEGYEGDDGDDGDDGDVEFDDNDEDFNFRAGSRASTLTSLSTIMLRLSDVGRDCVSLAMKDDKQAQCQIGCWSLKGGEGIEKDPREAHYWFSLAAVDPDGVVLASRLLGMLYDQGLGVFKDPLQALKHFEDAARKSDPPAQLKLAFIYRTGNRVVAKDIRMAHFWMDKAAVSGHPVAEHGLGWHHEHGLGTIKCSITAARLYRRASDKGYRDAQNRLGWLYQVGQGISRNYGSAAAYYKEAAAQGHVEAHFRLYTLHAQGSRRCGKCPRCLRGLGRQPRQSQRHQLYCSAPLMHSDHPIVRACPVDVNDIQQRVARYDPAALFELAQIYEHGDNQTVQPNNREAYDLYLKAANRGYRPAMLALGAFHLRQQVSADDYDQAQRFFNLAAAQNDPRALTWLAWMALAKRAEAEAVAAAIDADVAQAMEVTEDRELKQAIQWLEQAARKTEPVALATLARLYEHGSVGVKKDYNQAWTYYFRAAMASNPIAQEWMVRAYESLKEESNRSREELWRAQARQWFALASQQ
ncbi:hypothetical protein BGZ73_006738 [Actinomortierella ambigua]|nr:hypothetical protein BGZ73_006738 [Actinomortierella ambigua]